MAFKPAKLRPLTPTMLEGAVRYAEADRSDPFAFHRAVSHIKNGVATMYDQQGRECYYDAERNVVTKSLRGDQLFSDGTFEYKGEEYTNRIRP